MNYAEVIKNIDIDVENIKSLIQRSSSIFLSLKDEYSKEDKVNWYIDEPILIKGMNIKIRVFFNEFYADDMSEINLREGHKVHSAFINPTVTTVLFWSESPKYNYNKKYITKNISTEEEYFLLSTEVSLDILYFKLLCETLYHNPDVIFPFSLFDMAE